MPVWKPTILHPVLSRRDSENPRFSSHLPVWSSWSVCWGREAGEGLSWWRFLLVQLFIISGWKTPTCTTWIQSRPRPYIPHPLLTEASNPQNSTEHFSKAFLHSLSWPFNSLGYTGQKGRQHLSTIKHIQTSGFVPCPKCSNAGMIWTAIWNQLQPLETVIENTVQDQLWGEPVTCDKKEKQKWIWNIRFPLFAQWGWCVLHIKKKKPQEFSYN